METLDGRIQDERRERTRTRPTPMAEYQIEDTSYKSDKPNQISQMVNTKKKSLKL